MMRKIVIIIFITLCNIVFAQTNPGNQSQYDPRIKNAPTSPEVALLGRFGDIPVGHYTGTAEVSIPLYSAKVDNIEIPLIMNYHTSGIKVADEATWVGLGWSFLPEGTITQEIRGREDWVSGGDGFANTSGYDTFKNNFPTLNSENQLYRLQKGNANYNDGYVTYYSGDDHMDIVNKLNERYGQPDIFTYNFCGYSGKFFYNPENNNEILFMESNNNVKFVRNTEGWIATTNKGDRFYFYAIETARSDKTDYNDISNTFKLTRILLVNGKEINFSYQDENTFKEYPIETAHITNFTMNMSVRKDNNRLSTLKKTLIGIETDNAKIEFNLDNREDIRPSNLLVPIKKLKSIDIIAKVSNKKIKSFLFNQSYFPYVISTEAYNVKRLKLDSIQQIDYDKDGNAILNTPPYSFEYDISHTMPSKISNSDFYGYYNGNSDDTLLPNLDYFDYLEKSPYKHPNHDFKYPYAGSMRYTNNDYVSTNILKKITYPTKGYTVFDYESNSFSNQFIPTMQQVSNAYKTTTYTHGGPGTGNGYVIVGNRFKLNQTTKVKFYNTIFDGFNSYYPSNHTDFARLQSSCKIQLLKTKKVNGQSVGETLKEWTITILRNEFEQTHQIIWDETLEIPYDDNPTTEYYVAVVNGVLSGYGQPIVSCRYSFYDYESIDRSISYGNGLRIKSIKNYDVNNSLLSHKKYEYNEGKLIYKFEPLNIVYGSTYKSQPAYLTLGCFMEYVSIFNDLSINSNDFGIGSNKPFGYSQVIEKDINVIDDTEKGYTKYYFTNIEPTGTSLKSLPRVDIPSNGENTLIEKYNKNGDKISSIFNVYNNILDSGVYPSFYIVNTSTGSYDPLNQFYPYVTEGCPIIGTSYTGYTYQNPQLTTKYNFLFSPLIIGKRRLKSVIETYYYITGNLVNKTENFYSDLGNLWLSKHTTPDGKVIDTQYMFADWQGNTLMIDKGMTGIPLITEVSSNGKIIGADYVEYPDRPNYPTVQAGSLVLPLSVKKLNLQIGNRSTVLTYEKYDDKGNILQYTEKGLNPTVIIWGYNQTQPIAKIEGISYNSLMALSGVSTLVNNAITASGADVDAATEQSLITALDNLRSDSSLSNYQITTYTYDPLIGVTSITPPSGIREIYKYDSANRLQSVVDVNGKILKEYQYNYKQ